jgi:hypothetical protein
MIRVCLLATACVDWAASPRGVQSSALRGRAKSRLVGERHGPAAAGKRQVVPRVDGERRRARLD